MKCVILVPAYQCEETIAETLNSLMAQGNALERVEAVYIADDASVDRTTEVAARTWTAATPLKILKPEKNRGEYVNVNEAVAQFPPDIDWFLIMHADNVAKQNWLVTFLDRAEASGERTGSICSSWDDWRADGTIVPGTNQCLDDRTLITGGGADVVRNTIHAGCWWHISSSIIRVAAFQDVGGLPRGLRLKGDWDFLLRLLSRGWNVEYVPVTLMKYRENAQGSSSLSFKLHSDVTETLHVVWWHRWVLTLPDIVRVHGRQLSNMVRRFGSSLVQGHWKRLFWSVPAVGRIITSFLRCSLARLDAPARRDTIPYNGLLP
jgi:glycosyltransferase involved in cell wall biosynthesis